MGIHFSFSAFKLQGNPPSLLVNSSLDLDTTPLATPVRTFTVVTSDGVSSVTATVTVNIANINEYTPTFTEATYRADVKENAVMGTSIIQVTFYIFFRFDLGNLNCKS